MSKINQQKRPGRPAGKRPDAVQDKLIEAAREIFIRDGFDGASTKKIAAFAGVNPAMINYYFGNKEGLSRAMMLDAMSPLISRLDIATKNLSQITLEDFLRGYMQTIAQNPWLPQLVVREVLPENGRLRDIFQSELANRVVKILPVILKREQQAGTLRTDLDPGLIMLSVMSLAVFPFVAIPIIEPAMGVHLDDDHLIERFIVHTLEVLNNGIGHGGTA